MKCPWNTVFAKTMSDTLSRLQFRQNGMGGGAWSCCPTSRAAESRPPSESTACWSAPSAPAVADRVVCSACLTLARALCLVPQPFFFCQALPSWHPPPKSGRSFHKTAFQIGVDFSGTLVYGLKRPGCMPKIRLGMKGLIAPRRLTHNRRLTHWIELQ